ncbi:hypothetical protein HJC23_010321 [Cyclotella cryptica]|uniref:ZP domain-containing protein n=1 Tax=Cyclotella cryptica TaxID=29204 RepID=A0ABD3QP80_9STRA|eukprot:CCRYP_003730-RA/>CCRYP_003730-RA protein AED:0.00 eAED:0.00 QI:317/1/1/1/1/1/2/558/456
MTTSSLALALFLPVCYASLRAATHGSATGADTARRTLSSLSDPSHCYPLLHAASSPSNTLDNERYFYFVDAMSNSYFSSSNVTAYASLPTEIQFSFVTLSCQCQLRGEREDCCIGTNAKLDSSGSDPDGPPPSEEQAAYLTDVCVITSTSIGDRIAPESGELPLTGVPTSSPAGTNGDGTSQDDEISNQIPTASPVVAAPQVNEPSGTGSNQNDRQVDANEGGLSGGAWAGIAIAGAAVGTMVLYLVMQRQNGDNDEEMELDAGTNEHDLHKERNALAIKTGEDVDHNGPISPASTMDATQSLTADAHSDVSSLPSSIGMSKSGENGEGYNGLNLLPGRPDEESVLSGDEENYFYNSNNLAGMGVASGAMVRMGANSSGDDESSISSKSHSSSVLLEDAMPHSSSLYSSALPPQHYTPGELDQAIENGNWEAVAASAAAIMGQSSSESVDSSKGVV